MPLPDVFGRWLVSLIAEMPAGNHCGDLRRRLIYAMEYFDEIDAKNIRAVRMYRIAQRIKKSELNSVTPFNLICISARVSVPVFMLKMPDAKRTSPCVPLKESDPM